MPNANVTKLYREGTDATQNVDDDVTNVAKTLGEATGCDFSPDFDADSWEVQQFDGVDASLLEQAKRSELRQLVPEARLD